MKLSVHQLVWRRILPAIFLIAMIMVGWWFFQPKASVSKLTDNELELLLSDMLLDEDDPPFAWMTISKETTYLTEPLDQHGRVDYFAAYNEKASKGVTAENNAAVRFVKAGFGLSDLSAEVQQLYYKRMGIEELPDPGPYFQDFDLSDDSDRKDFDRAMTEPWSADTYPRFSAWLNDNQSPLELFIEGTRCPFCYIPLIPAPGSMRLIDTLLPVAQFCRSFARALVLRAMLRLNEGRIPEAQQDLLACHRLARLIGSTHTLIVAMVSFEIDRRACLGDAALLRSGKLSASDSLAYRDELRRLPPLPDVIEEVDDFQRLMLLDSAAAWQLKRYAQWQEGFEELQPEQIDRLKEMYDEILRVCNQGVDRFVKAGRLPTYSDRVRGVQQEVDSLRKFLSAINGVTDRSDPRMATFLAEKKRALQGASPREVGQEVGRIYFSMLMPMVPLEAEAKARTRVELGETGFALAAYYADHGEYPQSLDTLIPHYISEFPNDHFDQRPLRYLKHARSYSLYSFGANGIDDGRYTEESHPRGDDLVLEIPFPQKDSR